MSQLEIFGLLFFMAPITGLFWLTFAWGVMELRSECRKINKDKNK